MNPQNSSPAIPVDNPCEYNLFDVFHLSKSEVGIRAIREEVHRARDRLCFGTFKSRNGQELALSEAEFNQMEATLLDPVARLRAEQFVHQPHLFLQKDELQQALALLGDGPDLIDRLLPQLQEMLLGRIARELPPLRPQPIADDLPWPDEPGPCELERPTAEEMILQER